MRSVLDCFCDEALTPVEPQAVNRSSIVLLEPAHVGIKQSVEFNLDTSIEKALQPLLEQRLKDLPNFVASPVMQKTVAVWAKGNDVLGDV